MPLYGDIRFAAPAELRGMTAAELHLAPDTEAERIEQWRKEELERAGYRRREAAELAARLDVDLHVAVALLQRGCPRETALQILL
jgi:hypothetical protein